MKDMIIGVETEHGLYFTNRKTGKPPENKEEILGRFSVLFDEHLKNINQCLLHPACEYLENGGRLYIDTNVHPEFATPECSSTIEIIKYLKAGHDNFYSFHKPIENKFKKAGYDIAITFLADNKALNPDRSNNDNDYNTYGTHENYCIPKDSYNQGLFKCLYPFFATRQIYSGAGGFFANKFNPSQLKSKLQYPYGFVLSPRAFFIEEELSSGTTSSRAMINTRHEPHADPEALWRLHILCGESNRSDWSNWLKIGATALVISAFCKKPGVFKNMPELINNLKASKVVSKDCDPNKKNVLCSSSNKERFYMSAVEIQKIYLEKVGEYAIGEKDDEEAKQIINEWAKILIMLERNDEELEYMLDWKIKQKLFRNIERRRKAKNKSFTDWNRADIDIKYHDISPDGIFSILEKEGEIKKLVSGNDVYEALMYPPLTTRALARGTAIKICKQLGLNRVIDNWTSMKIDGESFILLNPFLTNRSTTGGLTESSPLRDIFAAHYPELDRFLKRKIIETLGNKPRI